jgi:hypothetical protein
MCWNESVSLNTFIFGAFAVAFALFNKIISVWEAIGIMSFVSMQLIEYFTWRHLKNKDINSLLSKLGLGLVFIQPLLVNTYLLPQNLLYIFLGLYAMFIALTFTVFYPIQDIDFAMHKAANGHLAWDWLKFPTFVLIIWLCFFTWPLLHSSYYFRFIITLASAGVIYYLYKSTETWGSMWCWIVNALSLYLITKVFSKELCY